MADTAPLAPGTEATYRKRLVRVVSYHDDGLHKETPSYWIKYLDTGSQSWAPAYRVVAKD